MYFSQHDFVFIIELSLFIFAKYRSFIFIHISLYQSLVLTMLDNVRLAVRVQNGQTVFAVVLQDGHI